MKNLLRYFIQGLLIIVPLAITGFVIFELVDFIGSLFKGFGIIVNPAIDPFIVFAIVALVVLITGMLGSSIFFRSMLSLLEAAIEKAPLVKIIYSSIKDFISAFVGNKKRFNKPVLVTTNKDSSVQQVGFITQDDLSHLGLGKEKVAVYIPLSYAFSGKLVIVPRENVVLLDVPATEAMKFIVSGGVSEIE